MTSARRLFSALLVSSVAGAAHAADPTATVRLDVRAPPECTSQPDLTARILARLRRNSFDDSTALAVRARFTALPSGNVVAELTLAKPGAKPSSRRLVARSCAQAADAAALIIAVTLDPTSINQTPGTSDEAPAKGEGSSQSSAGSSSAEAQPNAVPDDTGSQPSREAPRPSPPPAALEPDEGGVDAASAAWAGTPRFGAQIAPQLLAGVAPKLMPSIAVYAIAGLDRDGPWSPAVMVGATHGFDTTVTASGGTAEFWLDAISLDACAIRIRLRTFEARACASTLVGRLSANGTDTGDPAGVVRRPFVATGAATVFAIRAHALIELTARTAGEVNLVRDSFEFAPFVFHSVPRVNFAASVGIGIRSR